MLYHFGLEGSPVRGHSTLPNNNASQIPPARKFSRIGGSDVYVSYPSKDPGKQVETAGKAPLTILICGWMDAQPAHLSKYTERYHNLYPSATQILKASVFPAVKLLHGLGINAGDLPETSGLLAHTFSNGGSVTLTSIAHHLANSSQLPPNRPALPAQAIILDSLPGIIDLRITILAFTAPIHSPIVRTLATIYFGALYIASTVWRRTIGQDGVAFFGRIHQDLSDSRLLPQHVPRTYLYSEGDQLVQPENVERHARETRDKLDGSGMDSGVVRLVKFEGSQHVSHARQDPERYWDVVTETWEDSCRK